MSAMVMVVVAAVAWVAHTYGMVTAAVIAVFAASSGALGVLGDTESWGLILGVVTPLLVAAVQQPKWSERTRALVHGAAAVVIGVLTVLANGQITDQSTLLTTIAVVLVASSATYGHFWKPTGIAPKIEAATSPKQLAPAGRYDPPSDAGGIDADGETGTGGDGRVV